MKELAKLECEDRINLAEDTEIGPLEILSSTVDTEPAERMLNFAWTREELDESVRSKGAWPEDVQVHEET